MGEGPDREPGEETPQGELLLDDDERELVRGEVAALLPALDGERRRRYEALDTAAAEGHVPADLAPHLESLLELALQTGRARRMYSAEGERLLTAVFSRTPRGRDLQANLGDVNKALRSLVGHNLESASVRMRTVGHFTVTLSTSAASLTLAVRPDGVDVESVSVGGS